MRCKSMKTASTRKRLPHFPTTTYESFVELLREQLAVDGTFKGAYLSEVLESKLTNGRESVSDEVRRTRAINKWLAREVINRETNRRIMFADDEDFLFLDTRGFPVSARDVIDWSRRQVAALLGSEIPWESLRGSFSGGASTSVRRGVGTVPRKYQVGTDITSAAFTAYSALTHSAWVMPRELEIVSGNVMFTVPKTSEIDRVACKEPELNMYCQKAVGDYIRRRLKTVGIDLDDQSINQELARVGSIDGSLATIDLSSASDSVTVQLVIELLPFEWSSLLLDIRSPITFIDGEQHQNEMIASMGNGFTFELESLLFWVLVRACAYFTRTCGRVSVYGDDIICPSSLKDSVESVLEFFGFTLNPSKSFWSGDFRESCGKHWNAGVEVTPFYVKEVPVDIPGWCRLLNRLRQWSSVAGVCDPRYYDIWALFSELIPAPLIGANDLASKSALVAPGRWNIATCRPIIMDDEATARTYQSGAYIRWLDTTEVRLAPPSSPALNLFSREGELVIRRISKVKSVTKNVPQFPQECGILP